MKMFCGGSLQIPSLKESKLLVPACRGMLGGGAGTDEEASCNVEEDGGQQNNSYLLFAMGFRQRNGVDELGGGRAAAHVY